MEQVLSSGSEVTFFVLGTGREEIHQALKIVEARQPEKFRLVLSYNESLAHQLYAASDFLLMPSVVEPCGLNQMYAMHYGTIPIVRQVGGLKDTVPDLQNSDQGRGFAFEHMDVQEATDKVNQALHFFANHPKKATALKDTLTTIDFSWEGSAAKYQHIYQNLLT